MKICCNKKCSNKFDGPGCICPDCRTKSIPPWRKGYPTTFRSIPEEV